MSSISGATSASVCRALAAIALGAALLASAAWAQDTMVRIRGTIESVEGGVYVVKSREGAELKLKLAPGGAVSAIVPANLADIKPGQYIGVAARPMADGSLKALGVSIFPEALRGLAEGHRPWDLEPQSTMTNANVEALVASKDGDVLTLKYKGGEQKVVLPDGVPITAFAPGDASELKPGAKFFVGAAKRLPDGTLETTRINVGRGISPAN